MPTVSENVKLLQISIAQTARAAGRDPASVQLVAISKAFPAEDVVQAVQAGQRIFGESYMQEAIQKMDEVARLCPAEDLIWHFIGPIQSNKTRLLAGHFDWAHGVDRMIIAERLSRQRMEMAQDDAASQRASRPSLNICLQINVSDEASKHGFSVQEVLEVAPRIACLPGLRLRGLMAVPAPETDKGRQRAAFAMVRETLERLNAIDFFQADATRLDTLSMGMSSDMDAAIAEGATLVRIGSAIFGHRDYG